MIKMTNKRRLVVRLTRSQHDRVKNNAEAKGYKTISSYIRAIALEHDLGFENKVNEIFIRLTENDSQNNNNKNIQKLTQFL